MLTVPPLIDSSLFVGKNAQKQNVFSWVLPAVTTEFTLDVYPLIEYLVAEKLLPASVYLGSIQFGVEAFYTTEVMSFVARDYTLVVNGDDGSSVEEDEEEEDESSSSKSAKPTPAPTSTLGSTNGTITTSTYAGSGQTLPPVVVTIPAPAGTTPTPTNAVGRNYVEYSGMWAALLVALF